jgi:hypothetical protein
MKMKMKEKRKKGNQTVLVVQKNKTVISGPHWKRAIPEKTQRGQRATAPAVCS